MRHIRVLIFGLIFLPQLLFGQAAVERFLPGSKSWGLGGSLVTQARDPSAIFWNPAALSGLKDREFLLSFDDFFGYNFVGLTQFLPTYGTFGIALSRIPMSDSTGIAAGHVSRGSLAWGFELFRGFAFGSNLNVEKYASDFALSGGVSLFLGNPRIGSLDYGWSEASPFQALDRLSLGITLHNVPLMHKNFEPSLLLGLSYLFPVNGILLNGGYHITQGKDTAHLGIGLEFSKRLCLLTGVEDFDNFGIGLSFREDIFNIDLTYLNDEERFNLTISARISQNPRALAETHFKSGQIYAHDKKYKLALQEYKNYLSYGLDSPRDRNVRKAIGRLEKQIASVKILVDSLYVVSQKLVAKREGKRLLGAALILNRILDIDPGYDKAREDLKVLRPVVDKFINFSFAEARQKFDAGEYVAAKQILDRILLFRKHDPKVLDFAEKLDDELTAIGEDYFYRGIGYYRQNKYEQAREQFLMASEYNANLEEVPIYLKRIEEKLKAKQDQIDQLMQEGQSLETRNNYVDAVQKYLQVLDLDNANEEAKSRIAYLKPKVEQYVNDRFEEGLRYYRHGDFPRAENLFELVLSIDPKHSGARSNLGSLRNERRAKISSYLSEAEAYLQNQDWPNALRFFELVLTINPDNVKANDGKKQAERLLQIDALYQEARKYVQGQNYPEAVEIYERILEMDPKNEKARIELIRAQGQIEELVSQYFNQGIDYFTLERYKDAIAMWDKALELNPNHERSLEYKKQAIERLRAIEALKPNN